MMNHIKTTTRSEQYHPYIERTRFPGGYYMYHGAKRSIPDPKFPSMDHVIGSRNMTMEDFDAAVVEAYEESLVKQQRHMKHIPCQK